MSMNVDIATAVTAPIFNPNPLMLLPFAAMLLSIALLPLIAKHHWERHYPKISVFLGAISVTYYLVVFHAGTRMLHTAAEYLSFIAFVGSLFVVSGGIHIRVKGEARPAVNALFLLFGAALANIVSTTGASMLLIRPWIRMNRYRFTKFHTAFFIFIVSNAGGCLTPIGDPPLFLGYLKGVPFWWITQRAWPAWCLVVPALVAVFYILDRRNFLRAPKSVRTAETAEETWRVEGVHNLAFLALIVAAVFIKRPTGLRELLMVAAALASYFATPRRLHEANEFMLEPIKEVAWLFAGIFATMVPALDYLELHGKQLGMSSPAAFYWLSGSLSAVLDNAPTYLAFLASAFGLHGLTLDNSSDMAVMLTQNASFIVAISFGSVFFGALTYIGNGPNFMVKSIVEHSNAAAPGFFGFTFKHALPILGPVLLVIAILYFA